MSHILFLPQITWRYIQVFAAILSTRQSGNFRMVISTSSLVLSSSKTTNLLSWSVGSEHFLCEKVQAPITNLRQNSFPVERIAFSGGHIRMQGKTIITTTLQELFTS